MKRIVFVAEFVSPANKPHMGGLDTLTYNLAKFLADKYEVHILTSYLDQTERLEYRDKITIHRVGVKRKMVQRGDFLKRANFSRSVESKIIELKPDLVNAIGFVSFNGSFKAAKRLDIPVTAIVLEIWQGDWIKNVGVFTGFCGEILEKVYLKKDFDRYIAISNFTRDKLVDKLNIPRQKISVVYCGVDLIAINAIGIEEKYRRPTVITICRLVEYKRVQDIIHAIGIVKSSMKDIKLKIIGEGPYESELKHLVIKEDLTDNVEFCGKINRNEDLIKILKQSHIFTLGSTVEGFGIVIVEAMASGVPFIAADIPAVREITGEGVGGFLVRPGSTQEISEAIQLLLNNHELYSLKSREGKEFVKRYDWKDIGQELEEVVIELLNNGD